MQIFRGIYFSSLMHLFIALPKDRTLDMTYTMLSALTIPALTAHHVSLELHSPILNKFRCNLREQFLYTFFLAERYTKFQVDFRKK